MAVGRHLGFCYKSKMALWYVADCPVSMSTTAKFGDNISNGGRVIAIFRFSKKRLATILDYFVAQKWHQRTLQAVHVHQHTKFGKEISNSGWIMEIFRFSKWRPAAILDFLDFVFRPPTKSTWWPEAIFKILCRSDLYFEDIAISIFRNLA